MWWSGQGREGGRQGPAGKHGSGSRELRAAGPTVRVVGTVGAGEMEELMRQLIGVVKGVKKTLGMIAQGIDNIVEALDLDWESEGRSKDGSKGDHEDEELEWEAAQELQDLKADKERVEGSGEESSVVQLPPYFVKKQVCNGFWVPNCVIE